MKRTLLVVLVLIVVATSGCTSALTPGDMTGDDSHSFLLQSAQIIDKIDDVVAPEEKSFLVIKYEIENLQSQNDSQRQWTELMKLEADDEYYDPILIETLDGQLWTTSLSKNEKQSGYVAFTVPEEISDFKLTVTFPTSQTDETYDFRPVDKRISVNADYVHTRLEQITRTKRIAVIGGLLAALSSAPIRYLGVILVPEDEIDELIEQTEDLDEDGKKTAIEDYLIAEGHGRLE